jgi:hypothetical protein
MLAKNEGKIKQQKFRQKDINGTFRNHYITESDPEAESA